MKNQDWRRALSAVELLVAVSIMLLMMSFLMTVYSSSTRAAKTTVCISNLRQIHAAYTLYESDYDAWAPFQPTDPEILTYTNQTRFECFAFKSGEPIVATRVSHYINVIGLPTRDPKRIALRQACIQLRAGSVPALMDKHHAGERARVMYGGQFMIIARRDGSVKRHPLLDVEVKNNVPVVAGHPPCDPSLIDLNY